MLNEKYIKNEIFEEIQEFKEFYNAMSDMILGTLSRGVGVPFNIDEIIFKAMEGTLDSINDTLLKGRINDAYPLLRKYYDAGIINIYTNIYLDDNFNFENFIVQKISDWVSGKASLPNFEVMSKYIQASSKVKEITNILYLNSGFKGSTFEGIRQRCNDHTHFLYYHNLLLNNGELLLENREEMLNLFRKDLQFLFLHHIAYLLYFREDYMRSSDYIDSLDAGTTPDEKSLFWVAPFIQKIFDKFIKKVNPQIAKTIKSKTLMQLD